MKTVLFFLSNLFRFKYAGILILLLVPTFFLTNKHSHDWGDDFAQYIYQAQQINSPSDSYKQVLNVEEFSSPKRSLFFSCVLAFVEPTSAISPYLNLISVLYIIAAVACFIFFTNRFTYMVSLMAALCLFYNFLFLRVKGEVLTEFLFVTLFYFTLHVILQNVVKYRYVIPVLLALLISVRFMGFSLLLAYVVYQIILGHNTKKQKLKEISICLVIVFGILFCISFFIIPNVKNNEVVLYGAYTLKKISFNSVINNIQIYSRYILYFFEQEIPSYANNIIAVFVVAFFAIGLFFSVKKSFGVIDIAFFAYLLFLFVFPYADDTIRYLIPVVPLFFYYIINGIVSSSNFLVLYLQHRFTFWFLAVLLLSNANTIWLSIRAKKAETGPYSIFIQQDFNKIKTICKPNETVAFCKPFLINLFCDRNSYYLTNDNYKSIQEKADYSLIPKKEIPILNLQTSEIEIAKGDTISLSYFYLIKRRD